MTARSHSTPWAENWRSIIHNPTRGRRRAGIRAGDDPGSPLCAGEPFETQPALAACSGVLIAEDLLLTAGHCTNGCSDLRFVFDYALTSSGSLPTLTSDDVYRCDTAVAEQDSASGLDYAVLHLTRPVVGRAPAPVRASTTALDPGTALVMSGYPWRMPLKITDTASVRSHAPSGTHFVTNLDAIRGNSGSGVFDSATKELLGILVRGDVHHALEQACTQIDAPLCER